MAEVIDVNLTGSLNVARAAYRHLCASRGSITFFASSSFTRGRPDYVAYSASKAALVNVDPGPCRGVGARRDPRQRGEPGAHGHPDAPGRLPGGGPDRGCWARQDVAMATIRLLRSDLTGQVRRREAPRRRRGLSTLEYRLSSVVLRVLGWLFGLLPGQPGPGRAGDRAARPPRGQPARDPRRRSATCAGADLVRALLEPYGYGLGRSSATSLRTVRGDVPRSDRGPGHRRQRLAPGPRRAASRRDDRRPGVARDGALKRFGVDTVVPPCRARADVPPPPLRLGRDLRRAEPGAVVAGAAHAGRPGASPWARHGRTCSSTPAAVAAARARVLAAHPALAGRRLVAVGADVPRPGQAPDRLDGDRRRAPARLLPEDAAWPSRPTRTWTRPSSPSTGSTSSRDQTRTSTTGSPPRTSW